MMMKRMKRVMVVGIKEKTRTKIRIKIAKMVKKTEKIKIRIKSEGQTKIEAKSEKGGAATVVVGAMIVRGLEAATYATRR